MRGTWTCLTTKGAPDGEVAWYQCRRFEVPAELAASSFQELQIGSGTGDLEFASALCFPKFAKGAPRGCTNFGKRALDIPTLMSSWR